MHVWTVCMDCTCIAVGSSNSKSAPETSCIKPLTPKVTKKYHDRDDTYEILRLLKSTPRCKGSKQIK